MNRQTAVLRRRVEISGTVFLFLMASIFPSSQVVSQMVTIEPPDTTVELNEIFDLNITADENIL